MEKRFCRLSRFVLHMGFILSISMTLYALLAPVLEVDILRRALLTPMLQHFLELPVAVVAECIICAILIESYHKTYK